MRVLLTGAAGQLGRCFIDRLPADWILMATDSQQLDITDPVAVSAVVAQFMPEAIVNAAAYTAVDKAESEPEKAKAINVDGPSFLAAAAAKLDIPFVHISTDYVFDGTASEPYCENTPCSPKSIYGQTKLDGEIAALKANPKTVVIRTAWVFSEYGNNFVKTMLRVGVQRTELGVVSDQYGCPTYAGDIAAVVIAMLSKPQLSYGIYHYCGDTAVSWFDFAQSIFKEAQACELYPHQVKVNPIASHEYPTPASRPAYSILSTDKISALNLRPSPWKQQLKIVLHKILSQ
ncbi:dTDP-4-dehydrorhamnose reductase [Serratia proteamaculans]|uniref:dTDP-4-dehydrorhamnose reductase n=1 Tax=Serratia proteamaculans TaxID=28151 RepID=UPI0021795031|nr:dTDP-4-dehydrorhamnose reductase [Serratia proteamaculans]CAI0781384.1 dTDP-4-dehydrorhamnose reductase [Serratia proteamaculans]CAI1570046.1 dTDP-4-dehydrorhamnose reductase [Serratia proteamaculans]CAI1664829.1 dTDP-4-dehydrorhamnose reductase [Serratia proteamaculans]